MITKLDRAEVYCFWFECECGYTYLRQNDNYCSECGRKIDSEEWGKAIRMESKVNYDNV